ncbi:MAG: TetR/AcrR family transcriptional regulator [Archangium sp.]
MATKKKPADQYHHGDLRSAIVQTAWKVVSKSGLDALSLRAVAEVLGVSHAAPGHHFAGKEGLIEALRQEAWKRFADELEPGLTEKEPLRATGRIYVRFAREHPRQVELMFRAGEPSADSQRAWNALATATKKQLGESMTATDAVVAWAMVHGLASLLLGGAMPPGVKEDELIERALTTVARGLKR